MKVSVANIYSQKTVLNTYVFKIRFLRSNVRKNIIELRNLCTGWKHKGKVLWLRVTLCR